MGLLNRHSDVIGVWFTHPVNVVPKVGDAAYGDSDVEYGVILDDEADTPAPFDSVAQVIEKREILDGDVVSTCRLNMPNDTPDIPVGSRVTLSPTFGGRVLNVVATARHDSGNDITPAFYTVWCA